MSRQPTPKSNRGVSPKQSFVADDYKSYAYKEEYVYHGFMWNVHRHIHTLYIHRQLNIK